MQLPTTDLGLLQKPIASYKSGFWFHTSSHVKQEKKSRIKVRFINKRDPTAMKQAAVVLLFLSLIALGLCSVPLPTPPGKTLAFSWTNCGSSSDPTKLTSLSVSPDPIVLGNNITLAAAGFLSTILPNILNPIRLHVIIELRTGQTVTAGAGFSVSLEIYKQIFGVWVI